LDELASLVHEREAMLHGIREGVVIVDPHGRILLVNAEARRLIDLPENAEGRTVDEVAGSIRLAGMLAGRTAGEDVLLVHGDRVIVANRMAVHRQGRHLGAVVTLRDRTELESLVRELDSVRGLTDAMRAQAHEFSNRLHTLSGLLALGHYDEAQRFIAEVTDADANLRRALSERIADPRIAALMLAKSVVAAERGVELQLVEDASLEHPLIDAREGLTLLGNLIDNALDAAACGDRRPPLVRVFLADDAGALLVRVRDTGAGVPPSERERVFEPGYSTKEGAARGVGLSLVRELVERRGGWIEVDDAEDGRSRIRLEAGDRHLNPAGTVHGGAIATLVDTAMGAAVKTTGDGSTATVEMKVTYLEPARPGTLVVDAQVRKRGRRITIVEAEVTQDDELVAHAIGTFTSAN
jgi:two-component system CitB family sensor kinase